jgi:hypothetical protein
LNFNFNLIFNFNFNVYNNLIELNFTFDFDVGGCPLRIADAVGDLAGVEAAVIGVQRTDDQRTVPLDQRARLEPRQRANGVVLAEPRDAEVARQTDRLARQLHLVPFQPCHVERWDDDGRSTCNPSVRFT